MANDPTGGREEDGEAEGGFENTPSQLDELSHAELRLMYDRSSQALLFAKNIQWRSVGASLLVFGALIALSFYGSSNKYLLSVLGIFTILLACGVIFVLAMYQFWQFNEIKRIVEIERHFSTLYRQIRDIKSTREGNAHRYTLLLFMCIVVILGAFISNIVIYRMI